MAAAPYPRVELLDHAALVIRWLLDGTRVTQLATALAEDVPLSLFR